MFANTKWISSSAFDITEMFEVTW